MKYIGGKYRLRNKISKILNLYRKPNQWFVEPFCGGCNITAVMSGNRISSDIDKDLIDMWSKLQDGWEPPYHLNRKLFDWYTKGNRKSYERKLVLLLGSFRGKQTGGYAQPGFYNNGSKRRPYRDYYRGSLISLKKDLSKLKGVVFKHNDYKDLKFPANSLIYCDPPYKDTMPYDFDFNHNIFWEWCRNQSKSGHTVIISEYNAPEDFKCIAEFPIKRFLGTGTKENIKKNLVVERLFMLDTL